MRVEDLRPSPADPWTDGYLAYVADVRAHDRLPEIFIRDLVAHEDRYRATIEEFIG